MTVLLFLTCTSLVGFGCFITGFLTGRATAPTYEPGCPVCHGAELSHEECEW